MNVNNLEKKSPKQQLNTISGNAASSALQQRGFSCVEKQRLNNFQSKKMFEELDSEYEIILGIYFAYVFRKMIIQ